MGWRMGAAEVESAGYSRQGDQLVLEIRKSICVQGAEERRTWLEE